MTVKKLVPLTGIVAVGLIFAAAMISGSTPNADASLQKVVAFYTKHDSDQMLSGILLALGTFFFLCFASVLSQALRKTDEAGGASAALSFAGGIVFSVGALIFAGLSFALGDAPEKLSPPALQALNVLNGDMFLPLAVGLMAFLIGSGIAVLKTGALPKWLGWVAIVGGAFTVTPLWFVPFISLGVWILIVSVLLSLGAKEAAGSTTVSS